MAMKPITFQYIPSVFGSVLENARATLEGSWDASGKYSEAWSTCEMEQFVHHDGGKCFRATLQLAEEEKGKTFHWGVRIKTPDGQSWWAIATEVADPGSKERYRSFQFQGIAQEERYYLTHCRRLGANKYHHEDGSWSARFAVWAPNAQMVELVYGTIWDLDDPKRIPVMPNRSLPKTRIGGGYIADDGYGINPQLAPVPMLRGPDGVWETPLEHPSLVGGLAIMNHRPYMFRITLEDGTVAYRTDLYSRCQIGFGANNPRGAHYTGWLGHLAGSGSCSVTIDPEQVTLNFEEDVWPEREFIDQAQFWADEFTDKNVPNKVEDLIIYELHTGALGFGSDKPGTIKDALALLDHLQATNINAIELLPLSEFGDGAENWGYATSHYFAIEYGGGGRDQFKFFIKECHRRGIAVIMDVVYNHFAHDAERAEFNYDSTQPEHNIYYWYQGNPSDYSFPEGGYVDNMSTAWAPCFHEEMVRKMFISSAVMLMREFHVDGFRVDQTTSIHSYNVLHADGRPLGVANMFGAKFLRELGRTLRMFKNDVMLLAEDHSDWNEVTTPVQEGGMGFDARWYSDFYHHLSGDTLQGGTAKLIFHAALYGGSGQPLQMDWFAGALSASAHQKLVYNESHDEAGNSPGPFFDPDWNQVDQDKRYTSERSLVVASNGAPLVGDTRKYAEARCRFGWGMTVLSAGVPMFLFGEEVGACKRFKYNAVLKNKEDILGLANGDGRYIRKFYADINRLRLNNQGLQSHNIDIVHVWNSTRVIAFRRWNDEQSFLVVASLADTPYPNGYLIRSDRIEPGHWNQVFNSDASIYGGDNTGNGNESILCVDGVIEVVVPFAGFVVLAQENACNKV